MKQFLLSLSLIGAVIIGNAQVVLNELYTDPKKGGNEFFELYNTSPKSVDIGCYTVVTPIRKGNGNGKLTGFYVLTFPSGTTIGPRSYFVGAAKSSFKLSSSSSTYTADLNWNKSGLLKKYTLKKVRGEEGYSITAATDNNNRVTNFLTAAYEFYLFDNTGKYINGFINTTGNGNKPIVPREITQALSPMKITGGSCSFSIDWATVTGAEYFAAGNNSGSHSFLGFAREGAGGLCGFWVTTKSVASVTPGAQNPVSLTSNDSGGITASAGFYCGAVNYSISAVKDNSVYPITVELYYDKNKNGKLDKGDTKQDVSPNINSASFSNSFKNVPAKQKVILVFRTNLGCIGKVVPLTAATGSLKAANATLKCNKSVTFQLDGITDSAETSYDFLFPLKAQLYFNGKPVDGAYATINSFSAKSLNITGYTIPDNTSNPEIRFITPVDCFNKTMSLTNMPATITVGGLINCFTSPGTKNYATYFVVPKATDAEAYPFTLTLYEDANKDGNITGDAILEQQYIIGQASFKDSAILNNPNSYAIVTAVSDQQGCASGFEAISSSCSALPVRFTAFTATRGKSNKSEVSLKWSTATEQNNRGFNVQRLVNGVWKTIAFVFTQATNGNSSAALNYEYKDNNTERSVTQYRIEQVDLDDKTSYSEVRSVMGLEQTGSMIVFPNPSSNGVVNVLFTNAAVRDVVVNDVSGRIIKQYQNITSSNLVIDRLPAGFFTIRVIDRTTGAIAVEKVIVQ